MIVSGLQVYPVTSGGQLRSSALAEALAQRGFDVAVYSLTGRRDGYLSGRRSEWARVADRVSELVDYSRISGFCQWLSYRFGLPPVWLTLLLRLRAPAALRAELARADLVVIDFPYVFPALRYARGARYLHSHNLEHALWRWPFSSWVRAIEKMAARASDGVLCCSRDEERFFAGLARRPRSIFAIGNRIDRRRFLPDPEERLRVRRQIGATDGDRVLLFSASRYPPNTEAFDFLRAFAREHASLLARLGLRILVVGSVSPGELREDRFHATGTVPRVEPYFQACDLAVNPVEQGSGTSLKLLEFVAAGLPVLSTSFGARGFDLREGEDYLGFTRDSLGTVLEETLASPLAAERLRGLAESARRRIALRKDGLDEWMAAL